ncbi:MAG: alkaline phosphatase D family protein [Rhodothermales bacterium]|nr:alkaline phosphatase D family protein [Rhodothermales bacterium]
MAVLSAAVLVLIAAPGCRRGEVGARLASVASPPASFLWMGALTPTSVEVVAGLPGGSPPARLVVGRDSALEEVAWRSPLIRPPEGGRPARIPVRGLEPDTRYYFAFVGGDGDRRGRGGTFRTPGVGAFSYRIAISSCASTGSSRPVFDAIRESDPLLFLHVGDAHYEDVATANPAAFRRAWRRILRAPAQARLYRSTPIAYVWDDHDYGPNNSSRTAPGQEAVRLVYREMVPHYPLPDDAVGGANAPIYQAFTIGRVRYILTDLRSERDPAGFGDADERTMLGPTQKAWFFEELRRAKGRYPLIVWVSSVPWIGPPQARSDRWSGYPGERREIATFLRDEGIRNLVIVSGDAHMVAIDDGSNADYAVGGGAPTPVIQAAPLDRPGSFKGGPYSEGVFVNDVAYPWNGQWVQMDVEDDGGDEVCATWTGYRTSWARRTTTPLLTWSQCFRSAPAEVELAQAE